MKRFQFRLETVLQYRKQLEDLALIAFQNALAEERRAGRELGDLQESLQNACQIGLGGSDGPIRLSLDAFKRQISNLIRQKRLQIEELSRITADKREKYLDSKRESKILHRLREKAWIVYQKSLEQQEQQEMDDLFLMKGKGDDQLERIT